MPIYRCSDFFFDELFIHSSPLFIRKQNAPVLDETRKYIPRTGNTPPSQSVFVSQVISVTTILSHIMHSSLFLGQAFRSHKQKQCISLLVPGNDLTHVSGPHRLFVIRIASSVLDIRCVRLGLEAGWPSSVYAERRAHQALLLATGMHSSSAWEGQPAFQTLQLTGDCGKGSRTNKEMSLILLKQKSRV